MLGVGVILLLILQNKDSFIETTSRLSQVLKIDNLKNFFELYNESNNVIYSESINEIADSVTNTIDSFKNNINRPIEEIILNILSNLLDFGFNFIIYFCNYGLNIILISFLLLHETFAGEQLKIRTTPLAYAFIKLNNLILKLKQALKRGFNIILNFLSQHKQKIILGLFIMLIANGFIYKILVELLIFIITYFIRMINLETYLVIFEIVESVFIFIYPKLKYIPLWIFIPAVILFVFIQSVSRANYKLKKNHQRLKDFVKNDLTQTCFINGCPGTGKTLLNMSLSLACEEYYIEELESKLLDYEMKYKYINFANIRAHPENYPEHEEYIRIYNLLSSRKSFIISNYAIYSPLFEDYSKIFNFDYMRVNKPTDTYPLEEYIIISLSEFDKEYNSHDDKKIVGEDGAATFFSTVSHDLKRHAKIFVDYQLRQQVPLRIRGNAEYFINIKDRKKKYPILLMVYYLPFKGLYKLTKHYIKKYETRKKRISKKSLRTGQATYKRNDITLPYAILRSIASGLKRICDWFDQFYYFKLSTTISQEDENDTATKGKKKALCINIRDLTYKNQYLYDSTFLSFSYEQKKNKEFKDLDTFTKLSPPKEELDKCNSRFYNKINGK